MKILDRIEGRTIDIERSSGANAQRRWMALLAFMFPVLFLHILRMHIYVKKDAIRNKSRKKKIL